MVFCWTCLIAAAAAFFVTAMMSRMRTVSGKCGNEVAMIMMKTDRVVL